MGEDIKAVGTVFHNIDIMGNISNYRPEYIEVSKGDNLPFRNISIGNIIRHVLSLIKQDMATAKIGWILCNIFGIPSVFLSIFSDLLNIQMQEPYKGIVSLLAIIYFIILIGRACIKLWAETIQTQEKSFDLKIKKIKKDMNGTTPLSDNVKK